MERPDDLLDEPLYIDGAFVRRWDDLSRLPRSGRAADGSSPRGVPRPRPAGTLEREPLTGGG